MSSSKISSPVPFAVLVVDDSSFITEVLKSFLLRFTPEVYTASDGKEGLEMFAKYSPPFVVSDVVMPNMNGLEMSREIKKINPDTFIVLTTAVDDKEYLVEAIEIAVDKYLPKPVDLKRLEKFLKEFQGTLEVKKTLEENRKLLEEYKKAMDAAAIFTIGDSTGKITYVNEEFCRATGYEPKEAVGRYYTDFKHPDMPKSVIRSVQKTLSKKEIWKGIIENITKEGESFFTDATFVPILDSTGDIVEFLGISYDITGLQGMNENNFESIFNADESLIIATDDKFEIRIANKAMLDMLQIDNIHEFYDTGGAICNSFLERDGYLSKRDFRGDDHRERFRAFKAMLTSGDKKQRKVAIKDPKGDERLFAVRVSTVSDKMFLSRQYNIFSFVDITELEMMREQQINNIKLSSIGKLAAGITHEINTPLTYIKGTLEILKMDLGDGCDSPLKDEFLSSCETMEDGIKRVSNIVESMREIAGVSGDKKREINIYTTIIYSLRMVYNRAKQICNLRINGKVFDIDMDKNKESVIVTAMPQRLEQVWIVLLNNALDEFSSSKLPFESRFIDVEVSETLDKIEVYFKDNAGGIDDSILPHIFEIFKSSKPQSGMGVGLNIAHSIVEAHEGGISAYNIDGGAVFKIELPKKQLGV